MRELIVARIKEIVQGNPPQLSSWYERHGRWHFGRKDTNEQRQAKAFKIIDGLTDEQLLEEFELIVMMSNRQWA